MLSNGEDSSGGGSRQPQQMVPTGARAKDDAVVAYLFQRPQSELVPPSSQGAHSKRWAVGDEMLLGQVDEHFHCYACYKCFYYNCIVLYNNNNNDDDKLTISNAS